MSIEAAPLASGGTEARLAGVAAMCGLSSVVPLLAWVSGIGAFHVWFLAVALPGLVVLVGLGVTAARRDDLVVLRHALVLGTVGGLVGTAGYDLFRIPFVAMGFRVLTPIDSYGVLLLDADGSSPLSGFVGWSYHVLNGVEFGITFACVALARRIRWAVVWALVLESATILTPFASAYGLWGRWVPIGIAYAAHVPYGLAIGFFTSSPGRRMAQLREVSPWPATSAIVAGLVVLSVWLRPWVRPADHDRAREVAAGPSALVVDEAFVPEILRTGSDGCVTVANTDDRAYVVGGVVGGVVGDSVLEAGATLVLCVEDHGMHRVRLDDEPWSGGFVILDES